MTREEANKLVRDTLNNYGGNHPLVAALEVLGLLKLDDPADVGSQATAALSGMSIMVRTYSKDSSDSIYGIVPLEPEAASAIINRLLNVGFKISK